jgi:predicted nucleotide-binding protein
MTRVRRKRPKVFIGSSNEGRSVAEAVKAGLEDVAKTSLWTGVFQVGGMTLTSLLDQARKVDFGVVVATADDDIEERGVQRKAARDNILFESGLFVGALGPERTLLIHPADLKLPSDLLGFTTARYELPEDLGEPIYRIREAIERLGRRGHVTVDLIVYLPGRWTTVATCVSPEP